MFARINVILSGAKNLLTCLRKLAFARDPSPAFSGFRMTMLFLFFVLSLALYTSPVFAQTPAPSTSKESPSTTLGTSKPTFEVPRTIPTTNYQLPTTISPTSPLYTDLLVNNMFHTFSCLAIGQSIIGQPCLTYQVTKDAQGMIQGVPVLSQVNLSGGTLGAVTSVIGALYMNPPVRTADYLASVGQGLGIGKVAHAQVGGSGAAVLSPILTLWQVSRNVSYIIMIIVFLVIGLMIMFRNRINPQTVITAQAALPGLVIGLILITFSYFLAGLISDMAFIGTNIVGYYFSAVRGQTNPPQNLVQEMSGESVLSIFGKFAGIVGPSQAESVASAVMAKMGEHAANVVRLVTGFFAAQFISPLTGSISSIGPWGLVAAPIITLIFGATGAANPPFLLGFMLAFIATLAIIYQMIKLLLRLVNSYLTIIFLTITAPFQLLFASLPGRQSIATGWVLNMLANILVFPTVLAVFYFVAFILGQSYGPLKVSDLNQPTENSIIPVAYADQIRIVASDTFPLFGGLNLDIIQMILAFGALMALPAIPDIVVKSIGRMGQAGQLIGQEIGGGIGQGRQYAGQAQSSVFGRIQGTTQEIAGKRALVWNPSTGEFERRVTEPGIMQVTRRRSWNPLKWGVKQP